MDPNATLKEILEIAERMISVDDRDAGELIEDSLQLVELVMALDEWMTKGGFLPEKWAARWKGITPVGGWNRRP